MVESGLPWLDVIVEKIKLKAALLSILASFESRGKRYRNAEPKITHHTLFPTLLSLSLSHSTDKTGHGESRQQHPYVSKPARLSLHARSPDHSSVVLLGPACSSAAGPGVTPTARRCLHYDRYHPVRPLVYLPLDASPPELNESSPHSTFLPTLNLYQEYSTVNGRVVGRSSRANVQPQGKSSVVSAGYSSSFPYLLPQLISSRRQLRRLA